MRVHANVRNLSPHITRHDRTWRGRARGRHLVVLMESVYTRLGEGECLHARLGRGRYMID